MGKVNKIKCFAMENISGTGTLHFNGRTVACRVDLDLDKNVFVVFVPLFSEDMEYIGSLNGKLRDTPISLSDVCLVSKLGLLKNDCIDNVFISSFGGGSWSIYESNVNKVFSFRSVDIGIRKIELSLKESFVEFDYDEFSAKNICFEYLFVGFCCSLDRPISLGDDLVDMSIMGDSEGILVKCDRPLGELMDIVQATIGLLQGSEVTFRSSLEDKKAKINLADHWGKSWVTLYRRRDDASDLAVKIFKYFRSLNSDVFQKTKRSLHFLFQGLDNRGLLEVRTINLLVFLEMTDDSDALTKNSISKTLGIGINDAYLIYNVRNSLFHHGETLEKSIQDAIEKAKKHSDKDPVTEFVIEADGQRTLAKFYFTLTMMFSRYWVRKVGFQGEYNDYSEIIGNI